MCLWFIGGNKFAKVKPDVVLMETLQCWIAMFQYRLKRWQNKETCYQKHLLQTHVSLNVYQFCHTGICFLSWSRNIFCYWTKNNSSRLAKLGNIEETCVRSKCFWQRVLSFCQGFTAFVWKKQKTLLIVICLFINRLRVFSDSLSWNC